MDFLEDFMSLWCCWGPVLLVIIIVIIGLIISKNNGEVLNEKKKQLRQLIEKQGINVSVQYEWQTSFNDRLYLYIVDKEKQKVFIYSNGMPDFKKIPFDKIIGYEILSDSQVTGGIGRALVGGVIAGDAGAIVGAQTAKKKIKSFKAVIYIEDIDNPKYELNLITRETTTNDIDYLKAVEFANNINASIKAIISNRGNSNPVKYSAKVISSNTQKPSVDKATKQDSIKERLTQLKELYENDLISQEEYEEKRADLLKGL